MITGKVLKVNQSLKNPVAHLQKVAPTVVPTNMVLVWKEERLQALKCLVTRVFQSVVGIVFPRSPDSLQPVLERLQVLRGAL